jgi:peroxiredoxin Q/BCP
MARTPRVGEEAPDLSPGSTRRWSASPRRDLASHEAFAAKHSLNVPLLADVDKQVARAYDAFSPRLGVKRAVIVIDEQGTVRHRHDHLLGLDYQSVDDLKAALDALPAAAR